MPKPFIACVLSLFFLNPIVEASDGRILIFGGTGQLGSEIVKNLIESREDFTVFAPPTSDRSRLKGLDVAYFIGDILSEADMERVFSETSYRAVYRCIRHTTRR